MNGLLRSLAVDLAIACACSGALVALLGSTSPRLKERDAALATYARAVHTVADRELEFAPEHPSPEQVRRSVASLGAFMDRRAGVRLDPGIADRLADLEQRTLDGHLARVPVAEVSAIFSEILCERIRDLSDDEISSVAAGFENLVPVGRLEAFGADLETRAAVARRLRGAPPGTGLKMPEGARNRLMLRFDGSGTLTTEQFVEKTKQFRDRLRSPQFLILAEMQGREIIEEFLDERLSIVEKALPETWGVARSDGLTPIQVLLTAYSAASDDSLLLTSDLLAEAQVSEIESRLPTGKGALSTERHTPFGRNGDFFSTPLDMALDTATVARLLDSIEKGGSR
jgi:hypothetical protein